MRVLWLAPLLLLAAHRPAAGQVFDFDVPSDDRWHYPFNLGATGTRPEASSFGAIGVDEPLFDGGSQDWYFNDRDAVLIIAWDTSASIPAGQGPDNYAVQALSVSVALPASEFFVPIWPIDLTPDEWFTFDLDNDGEINADGIPRGQPGDIDGESDDPDPGRAIELFGAGFGPTHTLENWTEFSSFVGANTAANGPRDPFPFVFRSNGDGTAEQLHVEDNIEGLHNDQLDPPVQSFTPAPWAIGVPQGYTPGGQITPFEVRFDVDLCLTDAHVLRYVQEGLDAGRLVFIVSTLNEEVPFGMSDPANRVIFITKEGAGPQASAPRLTLELGGPFEDCNENGIPDDCDGGADCNENGVLDECDIASGGSLDEDLNGVPDECVCAVAADCADADLDGVRDDPCMFYRCIAGACFVTPRATQADFAGFAGACFMDGVCDINDKFAAQNCFANQGTQGSPPYPCEPAAPSAINVDGVGFAGSCLLDGVCDINDAFAAENCFANQDTGGSQPFPCSCAGPEPDEGPRPELVEAEGPELVEGAQPDPVALTGITLLGPETARPGDIVEIDVYLDAPLKALRGYQLHVGTRGGRRGTLELLDISVRQDRRNAAFAAKVEPWVTFNVHTQQMLAGVSPRGVPTGADVYLATFSYRVPADAAGTFVIDVLFDDDSPIPANRTFLFATPHDKIGIEHVTPATVTVAPARATLRRARGGM